MGDLNKISNEKLLYKGDFLQWQDTIHSVFYSQLAKALVINDPQLERPDEPPNGTGAENLRRQKLVDDWDKANELATAAILSNLPPRYKYLVCDNDMTAR